LVAGEGGAELDFAAVEDADAAARHQDIELVGAKIATGVRRLDDHRLASDRTGGKGKSS
jgi:hypothetical protein